MENLHLPIELIDLISKKCDKRTKFNVCLSSKELYKYNKKYFLDMETIYFCTKINTMITNYIFSKNTYSKHTRVKCLHGIIRKILEFPHVIKNNDKLTCIISKKLDEWSTQGLSKQKCKMYKKKLEL